LGLYKFDGVAIFGVSTIAFGQDRFFVALVALLLPGAGDRVRFGSGVATGGGGGLAGLLFPRLLRLQSFERLKDY
jgi:hypothetical protein